MEQGANSFLADIKKYEDTLAKDPKSFCFAPLSDLYRKHGLLDEAVKVAKNGCEIHPGYVGGFLALGRAYYEKGQKEDSKAALEKVIQVTPDNHLAQKLLAQLYIETGDTLAAASSLNSVLSMHPHDAESKALLNALSADLSDSEPTSDEAEVCFSANTAEIMDESTLEYELALDDAEIIEELTEEVSHHKIDHHHTEVRHPSFKQQNEGAIKDPFKTATLAELYVSQGVLDSALAIYKDLVHQYPDNPSYLQRVAELEETMAGTLSDAPGPEIDVTHEDSPDLSLNAGAATVSKDHALSELEKWLENIKRRR